VPFFGQRFLFIRGITATFPARCLRKRRR
jgi:hypothetical protein